MKNSFSAGEDDRPVACSNPSAVMARWPSLEIGRNSVKPCTRPRQSDSIQSIADPRVGRRSQGEVGAGGFFGFGTANIK